MFEVCAFLKRGSIYQLSIFFHFGEIHISYCHSDLFYCYPTIIILFHLISCKRYFFRNFELPYRYDIRGWGFLAILEGGLGISCYSQLPGRICNRSQVCVIRAYLALTDELWVSFLCYLEKSDRAISAHCIVMFLWRRGFDV